MDKNNQRIEKIASLIILWGLLVIAFFRPLIDGITWPWSNTYAQILILFLLAVWLLKMTVQGELVFHRTPLDIPILLFSLALIISVFGSVNKEVSFRQLYQFLSYPVLYFIIVNNLGKKLTPRQGAALVFSLFLTIALAGAVWLRGIGLPWFSALAPALAVIAVSIPLFRSPKIIRGENITIHSILLPLMLIVVILVSLYGIYQYYWGLERTRQLVQQMQNVQFPPAFLARLEVHRVFSTFVFPPALAGYLAIVLPLALALFILVRSGWLRVWSGLTLILGGFCLFLTFSEGGWISFALAVFLFIFILSGPRCRRLLWLSFPLVSGLFLALLLSGFLPEVDWVRFQASTRVRIEYWRAGLGMLKDYPLFGSGLGTWGCIYARYKLPGAEETQLAHNNYLQIWTETGILGIISFFWLWVAFLRAGWKIANGPSPIAHRQSLMAHHPSPITHHQRAWSSGVM